MVEKLTSAVIRKSLILWVPQNSLIRINEYVLLKPVKKKYNSESGFLVFLIYYFGEKTKLAADKSVYKNRI